MEWLIVFAVLTWLPPKAPDFPELPEDYKLWEEYDSETYKSILRIEREGDSFSLPYRFTGSNLIATYSGGDSISGYLHYVTDTLVWFKNGWGYGDVFIRWKPHNKDSSILEDNLMPLHYYWISWAVYLAPDKQGIEDITIGGKEGYRRRGRFWAGQCDWGSQWVGSFTTYFIPTETFDFRITCTTMLYSYTHEDEKIKTFLDRIRELERAVEQTFRVK